MADIYPLLCEPFPAPKVWAGRRLETLFGKPLPSGLAVGEAWEAADLPEGQSRIANGPLAGRTLGEVTAAWGAALTGTAGAGGRFPLLVKLLDAGDDLSVQVHPSDHDCARWFPDHRGKDEAWIVLDAEPSGRIIKGFLPGADLDEFDRRSDSGTLPLCLNVLPARPGDVHRIAPGTIHALLRGVVILEIQQPSDSTFRVYDYGRDDPGRPLHLAEARRVLRFDEPAEPPQVPLAEGLELLVDVPAYRIERLSGRASCEWRVDPRSVQVLVVTAGRGELHSEEGSVALSAGRTVILPAALGRVEFRPQGQVAAILAGLGGAPLCEVGR
ncbi:MAG: class I mannose-6-phosphate isomerase [Armatimonadetes bacterium]|nr:class I mannose-6-phosphate isomerase [Armatimonadota bacterium]